MLAASPVAHRIFAVLIFLPPVARTPSRRRRNACLATTLNDRSDIRLGKSSGLPLPQRGRRYRAGPPPAECRRRPLPSPPRQRRNEGGGARIPHRRAGDAG